MNMARHALCNSFITVLLILQSNCEVPDWFVKQKVTRYGESLTLFCPVENCCKEDSGWDLFNPSRKTLFIDVREVHKGFTPKYTPATSTSGFSLTINNLTRDDLNINYSCTYGFKEGTPKLLLEQNVFKNETDVTKATKNHIGLIVGCILAAVAVIVIIIIIVVMLRRKHTSNNDSKRESKEGDQTSQFIKDVENGKADTRTSSPCPTEENEGLLPEQNVSPRSMDFINLSELKKPTLENKHYQGEQKISELKSTEINLPINSENHSDIVKNDSGEKKGSFVDNNLPCNSEKQPSIICAKPNSPISADALRTEQQYVDLANKIECYEEPVGENDIETFDDWVKGRLPKGKGELPLTDLYLLHFSKCVNANGMCQLGTVLDISKPEIENIEYKHSRSPSAAAHALLVKWRNKAGPEATVRFLVEKLFHAHRDAPDSIYTDEIWKAIKKL